MRPLAWLLRLGATVAAGALLIVAVVVGVAPRLWQVANAHDELPVTLPPFESLSQRTYVYDVKGNVIAVFERENSQPIKLAQVPEPVIDAILAVEDEEFYLHRGVNVRGLIRATLSNFASDAPRQGASTVTQQVVKNELLAGLERDGRYKLLQVHYALMLEKKMTKERILERYLNTVFFGNNAYGLQAAAEVYFGKGVEQLTMVEGAFLAGLIRSPSGYDPIRRPERSRSRFRQVVDRLVDVDLLTPFNAAVVFDQFQIPETATTIPTLDIEPTYYTEALRQYLLEKSAILGDTEQDRANRLYRGGLRIHTTFDPDLQAMAVAARDTLPPTAVGIDAAVLTLDSKSGAIRAMVGGRGFGNGPGQSEINMALVPRQTGSSIKLFILAAALAAGAQPDDLIDGRRGCVLPNPGDPKNPFPINDGVSGQLGRLDQATWLSLNCAYARLSQIVGLNRVVDTVYRMAPSPYLYPGQSKDEREPVMPYASFATGANELSPMDMASGAQTLANNGVHHEPYYVEWIERANGTRLYTHDDPGEPVLDPGVALTGTSILKGVLTNGTARRALSDFPYPAAGKTGTQQDNTNSWFVGYTPHLTTAVWVGDPDGYTPMVQRFTPEFYEIDGVTEVQGGTYPARIWRAMMEPAHATLPLEDWGPPPPTARAPARLFLPGEECAYRVVSGSLPSPGGATTSTSTPPVETYPPTVDPDTGETIPGGVVETVPATLAPVVIQLISATTIPPNNLDPRAPLPTIDVRSTVLSCASLPPNVVTTSNTIPLPTAAP